MLTCECPICNSKIDLEGYEENELLECPKCSTILEVVSLTPPILEEVSGEGDEW